MRGKEEPKQAATKVLSIRIWVVCPLCGTRYLVDRVCCTPDDVAAWKEEMGDPPILCSGCREAPRQKDCKAAARLTPQDDRTWRKKG